MTSAPKTMQHLNSNIPSMFNCCADPVVHLLLLKSSMGRSMSSLFILRYLWFSLFSNSKSSMTRQNEWWSCIILACIHSSSDVVQGLLDFSSIYVIRQLRQLYASRTVHTSQNNAYSLILPWLDDFEEIFRACIVCRNLLVSSQPSPFHDFHQILFFSKHPTS